MRASSFGICFIAFFLCTSVFVVDSVALRKSNLSNGANVLDMVDDYGDFLSDENVMLSSVDELINHHQSVVDTPPYHDVDAEFSLAPAPADHSSKRIGQSRRPIKTVVLGPDTTLWVYKRTDGGISIVVTRKYRRGYKKSWCRRVAFGDHDMEDSLPRTSWRSCYTVTRVANGEEHEIEMMHGAVHVSVDTENQTGAVHVNPHDLEDYTEEHQHEVHHDDHHEDHEVHHDDHHEVHHDDHHEVHHDDHHEATTQPIHHETFEPVHHDDHHEATTQPIHHETFEPVHHYDHHEATTQPIHHETFEPVKSEDERRCERKGRKFFFNRRSYRCEEKFDKTVILPNHAKAPSSERTIHIVEKADIHARHAMEKKEKLDQLIKINEKALAGEQARSKCAEKKYADMKDFATGNAAGIRTKEGMDQASQKSRAAIETQAKNMESVISKTVVDFKKDLAAAKETMMKQSSENRKKLNEQEIKDRKYKLDLKEKIANTASSIESTKKDLFTALDHTRTHVLDAVSNENIDIEAKVDTETKAVLAEINKLSTLKFSQKSTKVLVDSKIKALMAAVATIKSNMHEHIKRITADLDKATAGVASQLDKGGYTAFSKELDRMLADLKTKIAALTEGETSYNMVAKMLNDASVEVEKHDQAANKKSKHFWEKKPKNNSKAVTKMFGVVAARVSEIDKVLDAKFHTLEDTVKSKLVHMRDETKLNIAKVQETVNTVSKDMTAANDFSLKKPDSYTTPTAVTDSVNKFECDIRSNAAKQLAAMETTLAKMIDDYRKSSTTAPVEVQKAIETETLKAADEISKSVATVTKTVDTNVAEMKKTAAPMQAQIEKLMLDQANKLAGQQVDKVQKALEDQVTKLVTDTHAQIGNVVIEALGLNKKVDAAVEKSVTDALNKTKSDAKAANDSIANLNKTLEDNKVSAVQAAALAVGAVASAAGAAAFSAAQSVAQKEFAKVVPQTGVCLFTDMGPIDLSKQSDRTLAVCTGKPLTFKLGDFKMTAPTVDFGYCTTEIKLLTKNVNFVYSKYMNFTMDRMDGAITVNGFSGIAVKKSIPLLGMNFIDNTIAVYIDRKDWNKKALLIQSKLTLGEFKKAVGNAIRPLVGSSKTSQAFLAQILNIIPDSYTAAGRLKMLSGGLDITKVTPDSKTQKDQLSLILDPTILEGLTLTPENYNQTETFSLLPFRLFDNKMEVQLSLAWNPFMNAKDQTITYNIGVIGTLKSPKTNSTERYKWTVFDFKALGISFTIESVKATISVGLKPSAALSGDLILTWPHFFNKGIDTVGFTLATTFNPVERTMTLSAALTRPWEQPFGMNGVVFNKMGLGVNIGPSPTGVTGLQWRYEIQITGKSGVPKLGQGAGYIDYTNPQKLGIFFNLDKVCINDFIYAIMKTTLPEGFNACTPSPIDAYFANDSFKVFGYSFTPGARLKFQNMPFMVIGLMDIDFNCSLDPPAINLSTAVQINTTLVNKVVNTLVDGLKKVFGKYMAFFPSNYDWAKYFPIQSMSMTNLTISIEVLRFPAIEIVFAGWIAELLGGKGTITIPQAEFRIADFFAFVKKMLDEVFRKIISSKWVQKFVEFITKELGHMVDFAKKIGSQLKQIGEDVSKKYDKIQSAVKGEMKKLTKQTKKVVADASKNVQKAADDMAKAAKSATKSVTKAFSSATKSATKAAKSATKSATKAAKSATKSVTKAFSSATKSATKAFSSATKSASKAAKKMKFWAMLESASETAPAPTTDSSQQVINEMGAVWSDSAAYLRTEKQVVLSKEDVATIAKMMKDPKSTPQQIDAMTQALQAAAASRVKLVASASPAAKDPDHAFKQAENNMFDFYTAAATLPPAAPATVTQASNTDAVASLNNILSRVQEQSVAMGVCNPASSSMGVSSLKNCVTANKNKDLCANLTNCHYDALSEACIPKDSLLANALATPVASTPKTSKASSLLELESYMDRSMAELEAATEAEAESESEMEMKVETETSAQLNAYKTALNTWLGTDSFVGAENTLEFHHAVLAKLSKDAITLDALQEASVIEGDMPITFSAADIQEIAERNWGPEMQQLAEDMHSVYPSF